ncbi:MAG: hypothetical protein E7386_06890 [Ruminococcaceae bacterium]|nr:hypothetical protein [Oscillospiraceae bacterium]
MDEFGESFESDSSLDSGMDLGGSESFDSLDSSDMSFTETEPLSEGFDEAPLEDYSSGGEDLSFDETPALEDYSSETAELPFDETPPLEDYTADTAELPFDEAAPLDDFSSDTEELPFDEVSPLEDPDMVPNDINDELDTLDAVEDDPSAMLDKAPEEDLSYFEDASLETAPESDAAELSEELPLDETVPESAEIPESSDSFEELPFDEAENVPESTEVTDISDESAMPETFEPAAEDGGAETYDFETAPETLDNVDPESSGELAPSDNPYSDAWEQFSEEVNEGDTQQADWDSLKEVPFAEESAEDMGLSETPDETAEAPELSESFENETVPEFTETPESEAETELAEMPENEADSELSETPEEVEESHEPAKNLSEYLNNHNYSQEDYETYSKDPEWRDLMRKEYPDTELPPLSEQDAKNNLSAYMNEHNWGMDDYAEYSQDPEWRRLHETAFPDDVLEPIDREDNLGEWHDVNPEISFRDNLDAVNPEYDESRPETFNNCQRCVPTYEMRERGYDVTAELCDDVDDYLSYHPYDVWENPEVLDTSGTGKEDIEKAMAEWGDGSRAQVVVTWDGLDAGHTFIAEQRGGKTVFIDPQNADSDCSLSFDDVALGETTFCRIDNLQPSSYILDCCKEVKK